MTKYIKLSNKALSITSLLITPAVVYWLLAGGLGIRHPLDDLLIGLGIGYRNREGLGMLIIALISIAGVAYRLQIGTAIIYILDRLLGVIVSLSAILKAIYSKV